MYDTWGFFIWPAVDLKLNFVAPYNLHVSHAIDATICKVVSSLPRHCPHLCFAFKGFVILAVRGLAGRRSRSIRSSTLPNPKPLIAISFFCLFHIVPSSQQLITGIARFSPNSSTSVAPCGIPNTKFTSASSMLIDNYLLVLKELLEELLEGLKKAISDEALWPYPYSYAACPYPLAICFISLAALAIFIFAYSIWSAMKGYLPATYLYTKSRANTAPKQQQPENKKPTVIKTSKAPAGMVIGLEITRNGIAKITAITV
ncbi:hypothetical protein M9H77_33938 [Catharanthus roseus]|uniref:Uncharacterized protein n=1 Tax=Catharanthus roseus TaxID=4058 RepID=A0ACB9ZLK5_CATRO|nr:hypothetical protein M9H77_33938 [Catharanthus roseus]